MPQGIDGFTIVLPKLTDLAACELKVYEGLDRLWRMVERYKMAAPIAIRVVDKKAMRSGNSRHSLSIRRLAIRGRNNCGGATSRR